MPFVLFVLLLLFLPQAQADLALPSSVGITQSFDNDENRSSSLDMTLATPGHAIFSAGLFHSHLNFSEEVTGQNRGAYVGVQSNPMRDWIFGFDYQYIEVSDQMRITNPTIFVRNFVGLFNYELNIGYRNIQTKVTDRSALLFRSEKDYVIDENLWWRLQLGLDYKKFQFGLSYQQYQYSLRFDFFNYPIAQNLGYSLDTINYGSSFADFIAFAYVKYFRERWDFTLDYSHVENEFDSSSVQTLTPSAGFQLNPKWYFTMSVGFSRGVTENADPRAGNFLSIGTIFYDSLW